MPILLEVTLFVLKGNDLAIACFCTRLKIAVFLYCLFARSVKVCVMIICVELCEFILKVLCWPWLVAKVTQNTGKISFIFPCFKHKQKGTQNHVLNKISKLIVLVMIVIKLTCKAGLCSQKYEHEDNVLLLLQCWSDGLDWLRDDNTNRVGLLCTFL